MYETDIMHHGFKRSAVCTTAHLTRHRDRRTDGRRKRTDKCASSRTVKQALWHTSLVFFADDVVVTAIMFDGVTVDATFIGAAGLIERTASCAGPVALTVLQASRVENGRRAWRHLVDWDVMGLCNDRS